MGRLAYCLEAFKKENILLGTFSVIVIFLRTFVASSSSGAQDFTIKTNITVTEDLKALARTMTVSRYGAKGFLS